MGVLLTRIPNPRCTRHTVRKCLYSAACVESWALLRHVSKGAVPVLISGPERSPKWQPSVWPSPPSSCVPTSCFYILACHWLNLVSWFCVYYNLWLGWIFHVFLCLHRATIEEVEGDVCELESKLDKVSTTHQKLCLIVPFSDTATFTSARTNTWD